MLRLRCQRAFWVMLATLVLFLATALVFLGPVVGSATAERPASGLLQPGDHIGIIGNTLADRMQHDGWLETLLHARFPGHKLAIRNLGFSGDELTLRLRSHNFGTTDQWLSQTGTDVVFAFFGYNESFAGPAGLEKPKAETLRAALEKRLGDGRKLLFADGFADPCGRSFKGQAEALDTARAADLVVLVVAEDCTASGEGVSRADLGLSGVQGEMLDALAETGKPVVLIIETGRPLALAGVADKVAALLS